MTLELTDTSECVMSTCPNKLACPSVTVTSGVDDCNLIVTFMSPNASLLRQINYTVRPVLLYIHCCSPQLVHRPL